MHTPRNSQSRSFTAESPLSPVSLSSGDVLKTEKAVVYIEPPFLPRTERATYETVANQDLPENFDYSLPLSDRVIVGEYRDKATHWYYAENPDGVVYRFKARAFFEAFPYSVSEYEYRKRAGLIPPFDPSASNVHPNSRPKIMIRVPPKRSAKKNGASKRHPSAGSLSDEEWEHDIAEGDNPHDDDDDDDDLRSVASSIHVRRRSARRSTVQGSSGRTDLPFSPRKTRFRKPPPSDSESSVTSVFDGDGPTRRSTRIRNTLGIGDTGHESEGTESEADSDKSFVPDRKSRSKGKPKVPKRGKASRAAYGHFRSIADLGYDEIEYGPLSAHRHTCERCQREPTHLLLQRQRKKATKSKAKRKSRDDESEEDSNSEDKLAALGGWVRCLKCPLAAHWRCLAGTQRDEILKAVQARDLVALEAAHGKGTADAGTAPDENKRKDLPIQLPLKRPGLESHQTTEFICSMCTKGGICLGCKEVALEPESLDNRKVDEHISLPGPAVLEGTDSISAHNLATGSQPNVPSKELLFRCRLCKRLAHYAHLPPPNEAMNDNTEEDYTEAIAEYYQNQDWSCSDCLSFAYRAEKILAWRPYPPNAIQPEIPLGESISPKMLLPREYLVKWQGRSYRRVQWVPHGWLASVHTGILRNFLTNGPRADLLDHAVREDQVANAVSEGGIGGASKESDDSRPEARSENATLSAISDAERRIPPAWKTVDRVLDVLVWSPNKQRSKTSKKKLKAKSVDADFPNPEVQKEWNDVFESGEAPSTRNTRTLDEWEAEAENDLSVEDIDRVVWAFIKWDDLGYDEATWDSPPRPGEPGYSAFKVAFGRFLESRKVHIKLRSKKQIEAFENRPKNEYRQRHALKEGGELNLGQQSHLKLMPFQVDGFNWLCDNWWNHQPSILADEMGLGKTVQIATFIGNIIKSFDACPILVVVPNSTITNWAREFASWTPGVRVVPFYGEAKSRDVIKRYELTHSTKIQGTTGAKFHVLVTTYDTITSKDFNTVIKSVPRWEVLVVDEGQRLKNDHGLLFKKLNELKISHRIIMTGTPLNNNIRELFNLMNFIDPNEWGDLERLEKEHEELTEDLVKELHNRLRPYFLRRLKGQVLQLPPKNEVIVPVSLTPLQKEVYKSVLGKNVEILKSLTSNDPQNSTKKLRTGSMNNILMDLRKCIQHPYLVSHDIEPKGLSPHEAHSRLVAGSAKLRLLQGLLPKLKARGHRVLLFSQFVIALDIIEDFVDGEGFKHLRLDGNTKQSERQKGMDEFNRPGSDVFIYLLSTRAGGVGINLWSADTVIIFDPDFNPHQDLQAIARAHRYGQTKPCLVFKLMAKDTAEERIVQNGKKKLVLDHVIVQKMDDEEGGSDVRSILTHGAQALFDETADARTITYSEQDLDKLIEKTETENEQQKEAGEDTGFSFAKVWTAENDGLEDVDDQAHGPSGAVDSWAHTLELIAKEQAQMKTTERTGRGVRRKAAMAAGNQQMVDFLDSPTKSISRGKKRKKSRSTASESDVYVNPNLSQSENSSDEPFQEDVRQDIAELHSPVVGNTKRSTGLSGNGSLPPQASLSVNRSAPTPAQPDGHRRQESAVCAMCGNLHQGTCGMTEDSENLVHYRQLLFTNDTGESFEERRDAIAIIDHTLEKRGQLRFVYNQPLRLVEKARNEASVPSRNNPNTRVHQTAPTPMPSSRPKTSSLQKGNPNTSSSSSGKSGAVPLGSTSQKRPSDAQAQGSAKKRHKTNNGPVCPVCGGPHHLVKDCPVTAAGPVSIRSAISRLKSQPGQAATVAALRSALQRHAERALGQIPNTGVRR